MSKRATLPSRRRKTCPTVLSLSPCVCPWSGLPSRSRTDCRTSTIIRSSMKAHRCDVRTDHGPLAGPVLAYCFAAMNVATLHTVGPDDIIGEHGQHAVDIPCVKAIVDALEEFDITIHWFSPW